MTESHSDNLTLDVEPGTTETVVVVSGEIDVHTARVLDELIAQLLESAAPAVVLDMAGVGFIDSSGLRSLLTAQRQFERANIAFALRRLSSAMRRLLEATGLLATFTIVD